MKIFTFLSLFALLLLSSGCMRFEYTGREFAPTPDDKVVKYFKNIKDVPAGVYSIIGRAELTADDSVEQEDLKEKLLSEARSRGADAVCLSSVRKQEYGLFESDGYSMGPNALSMNPYNQTPSGEQLELDMDGNVTKLKSERYKGVEIVIRALFLKNKKQLESIIAQREKQLDNLIGKPAEQPMPETIQKNITVQPVSKNKFKSNNKPIPAESAETKNDTAEKK